MLVNSSAKGSSPLRLHSSAAIGITNRPPFMSTVQAPVAPNRTVASRCSIHCLTLEATPLTRTAVLALSRASCLASTTKALESLPLKFRYKATPLGVRVQPCLVLLIIPALEKCLMIVRIVPSPRPSFLDNCILPTDTSSPIRRSVQHTCVYMKPGTGPALGISV